MKKIRITAFALAIVIAAAALTGCFGGKSGTKSGAKDDYDGRPTDKRVEADISQVKKSLSNFALTERPPPGSAKKLDAP